MPKECSESRPLEELSLKCNALTRMRVLVLYMPWAFDYSGIYHFCGAETIFVCNWITDKVKGLFFGFDFTKSKLFPVGTLYTLF